MGRGDETSLIGEVCLGADKRQMLRPPRIAFAVPLILGILKSVSTTGFGERLALYMAKWLHL
jgi:hypothetical protein